MADGRGNPNGSLYEDVTFRPPDDVAKKLLQQAAKEHEAPLLLLQSLLELEEEKVHLSKRRNVKEQIRQLVEEHLEQNPSQDQVKDQGA